MTAELEQRADPVGDRRRRLVGDRLASGQQDPGERVGHGFDATSLVPRHRLDDLLEGEAHLLAGPRERQRGRLVGPAPDPRLGDVVKEWPAGRPGRGERLERRRERQARDLPREAQ